MSNENLFSGRNLIVLVARIEVYDSKRNEDDEIGLTVRDEVMAASAFVSIIKVVLRFLVIVIMNPTDVSN